MTDAPTEVRHDAAANRFVLADDGREPELVYRKRPGRLILIHTAVPDDLAGRGIGGRLIRIAITRARAEHLTIVPLCPFVQRWLTEHPDEAESVPIDWETQPPPPGSGSDG